MRRLSCLGLFLVFVLFACAPQPVSVPVEVPSPTVPPPPAHADEIRFALIGEAQQVNVWQLFDGTGSTYANRALLSGILAEPVSSRSNGFFSFQPFAAEGLPSEVTQEGDIYSATVKLRADLKWTDGSPFTAEDVAFTANTILAFEFGYDWGAFYPLEYLDHAEALTRPR